MSLFFISWLGVMGTLWYVSWLWLSFEKPSKHPTISQQELIYIEESIGETPTAYPKVCVVVLTP